MNIQNSSSLPITPMLLAFALILAFSQPGFAKEKECCWIDVKTGKQVPTVPSSGANYVMNPENAGLASVALLSRDGKTARNSKTGQNYAKEPDGCWIDVKTGKRVPTAPASGANYVMNPENAGLASVALLSRDGKTARNSKTGQNYALEPCPPPGTTQPAPTPSTTDKVTDVLKTIGSSVSIGIGGGGTFGGGDHRHGGEDRHRTADKVSTDKTKTHTTSPTTTHKTVTSACKCHPCTCSPCTCH